MISLFLDLSKAFDTVNHQILLNKLRYYGLQQSEYNGFQSYLSNRKQQHLSLCIILLFILTLIILVHFGEIIITLHCLKSKSYKTKRFVL